MCCCSVREVGRGLQVVAWWKYSIIGWLLPLPCFHNPHAAGNGIEVRGGLNLAVRDVRVVNAGGSGLLLGGGARNVVVERTLVR